MSLIQDISGPSRKPPAKNKAVQSTKQTTAQGIKRTYKTTKLPKPTMEPVKQMAVRARPVRKEREVTSQPQSTEVPAGHYRNFGPHPLLRNQRNTQARKPLSRPVQDTLSPLQEARTASVNQTAKSLERPEQTVPQTGTRPNFIEDDSEEQFDFLNDDFFAEQRPARNASAKDKPKFYYAFFKFLRLR
ncbi:MAG TPA: hypothetical protein VK978_04700 [Candidatus Saccharimonadales bacterium]|nr:hypothetical protein [Candidatus Saccharimonadales bacterium]